MFLYDHLKQEEKQKASYVTVKGYDTGTVQNGNTSNSNKDDSGKNGSESMKTEN